MKARSTMHTSDSSNSAHTPSLARRRWLMRSGAGLAGALGLGTLGNLMLSPRQAHAADYKALVCIFLYGGNDGLNCVVPTDSWRYQQYAEVRKGLAIPRASLSGMSGSSFGLHPSLFALRSAWDSGHLAPVFNLGPLNRPLSKEDFRSAPNASPIVPDNLFSHSDQQTLWETANSKSLTRTGWGGGASTVLGTANPVISVGGTSRFGQTTLQSALALPSTPGDNFGAWSLQPADMAWAPQKARKAALDALYSQSHDTALGDAFAASQRNAFVVSERLADIVKVAPRGPGANAAIDAAFAPLITAGNTLTTPLARQLYQVAKLVAGSATLQGNRQIFFAQMGGFDNHANQAITGSPTEGEHARLLRELGDALACFTFAMKTLGLGDAVTAFTQSDFGRTFAPNQSNGTDHGWGNTHLVVGGAVKGGTTYGTYPDLVLGGPSDVGVEDWEKQGRWLPTTSVDQYAATLLSWFGAGDAQLSQILPNLDHFAMRRLAFL